MQIVSDVADSGSRVSRFTENLESDGEPVIPILNPRPRVVRFRSTSEVFVTYDYDDPDAKHAFRQRGDDPIAPDYTIVLKNCPERGFVHARRIDPVISGTISSRWLSTILVLSTVLLVIVQPLPLVDWTWIDLLRPSNGIPKPVDRQTIGHQLNHRQDTADGYCTRWSSQTAIVNGTLYSYGGRATQSAGQTQDTWNNDFLSLDLSKSWDISTPSLQALQQPSGPPAVANGYLWHSLTSLYLYGGEYSDSPPATPSAYVLWEYDLSGKTWKQHANPQTTAGNNSASGNLPVQEAAEGAGITVPGLGRGYYFGGHHDYLTTAGWSIQTQRIYLKSMIEFTFPGSINNGVNGLVTTPAGPDGAWRNITQGGLQDTNGFTERADGVLVHIPGYGQQGIILGLAGGTNTTFTEMNVIDVYDIATSTWFKQSTQGGPPPIRVNPCAVAATAPDGSSTNVYMYGGQNLQPYKQQTQYGDMWILTIPSFTWIQVQDSDGAPPNRAGHACEIWDGQMIVVGGYVGTQISCDSPGIYVFDATKLTWQTSFNALSGGDDQSQQSAQSGNPQALPGSYGYQVPGLVQSVIGGSSLGGATVTQPAASATAGPLATGGGPLKYTATVSGQIVGATGNSGNGQTTNSEGPAPNVAAIAAGTVAGVLFVLACYLAFCLYLYWRALQIYKNHVATAQRAILAQGREKPNFFAGPNSSGQQSNAPSGANGHHAANGGSNTQAMQRNSSSASSSANLQYHEPTFVGVLLRPRRSLRVVNRD